MTFESHAEPLDARTLRSRPSYEGEPLEWRRVIGLWEDDPPFRAAFVRFLADAPFEAYRWETPSLTASTTDEPFELVLLDSPLLAVEPDASAFAEHFVPAGESDTVTFPNLGGDAVLVAPCPRGPHSAYGHLAAFAREGSAEQNDALWRAVGRATRETLGEEPTWLSTAGGGVPWLHVRLDSSPKYYGHAPYRVA